ncbi:MAG: BREX system ATP-binding domain-containing protein [Syntrophales bacterium]
MYITPQEWLDTINSEYLQTFIKHGGAAVKFAVPMECIDHNNLLSTLKLYSEQENFLFTSVDAVKTKIHMTDKLFHEIARQIYWDELSHAFVEKVFLENGYQLPELREDFNLQRIAAINNREETFLRKEIHSWLEEKIFHDFEMCQEFRIAMIRLCLDQLDAGAATPFLSNAVKEWLRGELRLMSTLKEALIFQKIARHNARHMLFSLAHWLRVNGKSGLVIAVDITRYLISTKSKEPDAGFFYSIPALLDAYEVLRQFIDGTDEMEGCLVVVIASKEFLSDDRRGLNRYDALKLRIYDEVRDKRRQNPLASLVRIGNGVTD